MSVTIINPEVLHDLYTNHGRFAAVCYDTPTKYAARVGRSCQQTGHMSGSRCEYIKFAIDNVDRGTAEQCLRHEIGTDVPFDMQDNYNITDYSELVTTIPADQIVKNMASFRYIDKDGFSWVTPASIRNCPEAEQLYNDMMTYTNTMRKLIKHALIENGVDGHRAVQDANFVLPRATTTKFVIGFTPEALIHFCHKRLCTRAQEFIRQLAVEMKAAVAEINPVFAEELVPQCEHLLWCPEGKRCCGRALTRADAMTYIGADVFLEKRKTAVEGQTKE